ncbi:sensor histidine kinase [Paenibacillus sp. 32352]|uniref:sensor histidine kinase n=1 Tax=Paenibacillus sp. 32352 TaxID=1969111 RepID=UPI0009AEB15D|nr:sensor histidine kinase [Paenibacillus sp. 32352]
MSAKSQSSCDWVRNKVAAAVPYRHWFDYVIIGTRTLWFLLGVHYLLSRSGGELSGSSGFAATGDRWFILLFYTLAYVTPMVLFLRRGIPRMFPVLAELLLNGTFFCLMAASPTVEFAFYNFPSIMLGYMSVGRIAVFSAATSVIVIPLLVGWFRGSGIETTISVAIEFGVLYGSGFCFQKLIASYGLITKQNQTLELYAKQIEALTLTEERNRLSRELHDTVGHTFATTITGMDAVHYLIDVDPQEAKNSLQELLEVTRNGLDEVRRHIHQIAPEQEERTLTEALSQIADEFALHTGTEIAVHVEGTEYTVSENVRLTMIRCLQESLTNANKHGKASSIRIELAYSEECVEIKIADDGKGASELVEGFGLKAMYERAANLNGTLAVTSHSDHGTVIACTIPTKKIHRK